MASSYTDFSLEITRGDRRTYVITVLNTDTGQPSPVTDWSLFWFRAKKSRTDTVAAFTKTDAVGGGISRTGSPMDPLELTIAEADTKALPNEKIKLFCEFQGKHNTYGIKTCATGILVMFPEEIEDET